MTVELRHLRSFVVLADELHFRRAARRLAITQPALSHQIADLESRLEIELLHRNQRHVGLTVAGETLRDGARKVIEEFDRLVEATRRAGAGAEKRVVIGHIEYATQQFMPGVVRRFQEKHPEVSVELREMHFVEVTAALTERTIDVGIVLWPLSAPALAGRPIVHGQWSVVVPIDHRFAKLDEVSTEELVKEPLIMFQRHLNPPGHDWLLIELGLEPDDKRIVYRTGQASSGPDLVAQGLGLFVVSSYVLGKLRDDVVLRPLAGFSRDIVLAAAWRADEVTSSLRALLDVIPKVAPPKVPLWSPGPARGSSPRSAPRARSNGRAPVSED